MRSILTLAKKEWRGFFTSPVGYIFAGLLLVLANWLYFADLFVLGQADLRPFFNVIAFLLSIFIPAVAMGLIADEKKNSTWEILLSLPIEEKQMVLGKFVGSALFVIYTLGLSFSTIVIVYLLGKPDSGTIVGGLVGLVLLALAYLATGIFMSSLSNQAIVGFLGASVLLIVNSLLGQEMFVSRLPTTVGMVIQNLSLNYRFSNFFDGLLEIKDVVFFLSWIVVFLILTVLTLKARNK